MYHLACNKALTVTPSTHWPGPSLHAYRHSAYLYISRPVLPHDIRVNLTSLGLSTVAHLPIIPYCYPSLDSATATQLISPIRNYTILQ